MNTILSFTAEVTLTLILSILLVRYLGPSLTRILTDLCGTEERGRFWTAFCNLLLIGMPVIFALNYNPKAMNTEALFFEVASKLSGNLGAMLVALVGIGIIVSFFALVAPKPKKMEA